MIGQRISDIRQSRGLTVQDLAKLIDVRPQYIISIEDGVQKAHTFTYRKIADALNVPLEMIINDNFKVPDASDWKSSFPEEYLWLIKSIMAVVITTGALWVLVALIVLSDLLFVWLIPSYH